MIEEATDLYLNLFPRRQPWGAECGTSEPQADRLLTGREMAAIRKSKESYRTLSRRFKVPQSRIAQVKRTTGSNRGPKTISEAAREKRNQQVLERFQAGESRTQIAREMGLSRDMVYRICAEVKRSDTKVSRHRKGCLGVNLKSTGT